MNVNDILDNFKSNEELREYCNVQYKTIISLNKEIRKLSEDIESLKSMAFQNLPVVNSVQNIEDEEVIARTQLSMLKNKSLVEPLTLEEARKFEIYSKALNAAANKPKIVEVKAKHLSNKELFAALEEAE